MITAFHQYSAPENSYSTNVLEVRIISAYAAWTVRSSRSNSTASPFRCSKKPCVGLQIYSGAYIFPSVKPVACTATVYDLIYATSETTSTQLQATVTTSSILRCAYADTMALHTACPSPTVITLRVQGRLPLSIQRKRRHVRERPGFRGA
jgi:hypothetical protein